MCTFKNLIDKGELTNSEKSSISGLHPDILNHTIFRQIFSGETVPLSIMLRTLVYSPEMEAQKATALA
jgi:hypothetical protein